MNDYRFEVQTAIDNVILREKLSGQLSRESITPVFAILTNAIGKVDVTELLSGWLKLVYGLAANPEAADLAPVAAEELSLQLRTRKLKASYALQIEALTNLAEHLVIDCTSPMAAKVVMSSVAWAIKQLHSDSYRHTERQWADQEYADKVTATNEACERLLPPRSSLKRSPGAEIVKALGPRQECEKIPVYFASFRGRSGGATHPYNMYGATWVDEPNYGCAIVSIPHFRKQFTLPRDVGKENSKREAEKIDRGRYFVVEKIIELDIERNLIDELRGRSRMKTLMVFIHGFRQSHVSALVHTAQMFKDFDIVGAPLLLSWPSGYLLGDQSYFDAIENAESQGIPKKFADIINTAASQTQAKRVVLIGHSLGSRLLAESLQFIRLADYKFQIILGSPDIEVGKFSQAVRPAIERGINLTVYASRRDKALRLATGVGSERAGRFPHKIAEKGIDVIATDLCYSEFFDINRHSDFSYGAAPDLRMTLCDLSPADRRLRALKAPNREIYWSFG